MNQETRKTLEAEYRRHCQPRDDGGLTFTLDDHLAQVRKYAGLGLSLDEHAAALGVSLQYLQTLKTAIEQET